MRKGPEKCLRQVEHIRGHVGNIYSIYSGQPSHGGDRKTFEILKVISWPDILTKSVEILLFILFI